MKRSPTIILKPGEVVRYRLMPAGEIMIDMNGPLVLHEDHLTAVEQARSAERREALRDAANQFGIWKCLGYGGEEGAAIRAKILALIDEETSR